MLIETVGEEAGWGGTAAPRLRAQVGMRLVFANLQYTYLGLLSTVPELISNLLP